eukprot:TRINITY_DN2006_c1_g1_i5.p1 TRINITY_DN2006_c1_g1~~TRINITY_DN2006_c1_g1_i5.p1  ORF type:complete len:491 (+),score=32.99 TRINITY_DN2006_c1_g1_i5:33-1505(+)
MEGRSSGSRLMTKRTANTFTQHNGILMCFQVLLIVCCFMSWTAAQSPSVAFCKFRATSLALQPLLTGNVTFTYNYASTTMNVTANIAWENFVNGSQYAMHIYEFGDLNVLDASTVESIFQGNGLDTHGCPPNIARREGDMGNWLATSGSIHQTVQMNKLLMRGQSESIIGRTLVLHAGTDDCTGTDGGSGAALAQCVIGIKSVQNNVALFEDPLPLATCSFEATTNSYCAGRACSGTVWFEQQDTGVRVTSQIYGLTLNSQHGIHVHNFGDWSLLDGTNFGAHYNPNNGLHDLPPVETRHMGDLGSIQSYSAQTGAAWYQYTATNIPDVTRLVGRSVVIHSLVDHGNGTGCDQSGSSGARILACVIGVGDSSVTQVPSVPVTPNNNWQSQVCDADKPITDTISDSADDPIIIALIIGWCVAGVSLLLNVLILYCWCCRRGSGRRGRYEEIDDRGSYGSGRYDQSPERERYYSRRSRSRSRYSPSASSSSF